MKTNTLYAGDCLDRMREWPPACVDLIYLDPPFNSKANYNILFGRGQDKNRKDDLAQMMAFTDTWYWDAAAEVRVNNISKAIDHPAHYSIKAFDTLFHGGNGMLAYLSYMAERLAEMHRILKPSGSIYLHCDPTASHYLKIVMDEIFGVKHFRNEILWCYTSPANTQKHFPRKHDAIFFYAKSDNCIFNPQRIPHKRRHLSAGATGMASRNKNFEEVRKLEALALKKGKLVENWWHDIPSGSHISKNERLGYPTQKPLALLERIIKASSNEGDVVLDPFCGCGTTIHAAHNLKRNWVGIDISYYIIEVIRRERMKDILEINLEGVPTDIASAEYFSDKDPFEFEKWAVTRIHGFASNTVQRGDEGIDGRALILNAEKGKDLCIAQVKRGTPSVDALRAFYGKIATGEAAIGLFITLHKQNPTPTVKKLTAQAGYIEIGGKKFERLVMWSIAEFFQEVDPKIPHLAHPRTGAPLQEDVLAKQDNIQDKIPAASPR